MSLKSKIVCLSGVTLLFLASCRKPEIAIRPLDRGDVITSFVDMNTDYKQQIYFSLSKNAVISANVKTVWDLAFECGSTGFHIKTNTAKAMCIYNTGQTSFTTVTDTSGFGANKRYDSPTGNPDSTAFDNWQTTKPVYLVDRGYNEAGAHLGFKKIQILSVNSSGYNVKVSDVNGNNEAILTVPKNESKNYVNFSLNSNSAVNAEPEKERYDLLFTQYTHTYSNPFSIYLVTGVLINPYKVKVARVFDKPFTEITISDTLSHLLKTHHNIIGFDWKTYDFQAAAYTIDATKCYLIKDQKGFYYKLHFINFYNSLGVKGFPKFEFKKL